MFIYITPEKDFAIRGGNLCSSVVQTSAICHIHLPKWKDKETKDHQPSFVTGNENRDQSFVAVTLKIIFNPDQQNFK